MDPKSIGAIVLAGTLTVEYLSHERQSEAGIAPIEIEKLPHIEIPGNDSSYVDKPPFVGPPPPPDVPFIPSSHDPSAMLIQAHKKYIDDYYACVLSSYSQPHSALLASVSSPS